MTSSPDTDADWFTSAIATHTTSHFVDVDDCSIHYRRWPGNEDSSRRGMLFVHGSAAHSHWWDHIAPSFAENHSVAALDLAGMGESSRRARYTIQSFRDEIAAVLHDSGFVNPDRPRPIVVAHSFGAFATAHLAAAQPDLIGCFIIVDSHLAVPRELRLATHSPFTSATRVYETRHQALARFRLIPSQPNSAPCVQDHIARHSVRKVPDGWVWKFEGSQLSDDNVGTAMFLEMEQILKSIHVPAALIYGERSVLVSPAIARHIAHSFPSPIPLIEIPTGHHHLMLDQPLALISALRGLMAGMAMEPKA